MVLIAGDLLAWMKGLCLEGELARAEPKRLRYTLLHSAGVVVRSARRTTLRIAEAGRGPTSSSTAFARARLGRNNHLTTARSASKKRSARSDKDLARLGACSPSLLARPTQFVDSRIPAGDRLWQHQLLQPQQLVTSEASGESY